jgi:methionyl-tRNA synthetase
VAQFGQDGSASVDSLHERYETELGNDLGNLLSRTTAMIARYRDGALPIAPRPDSRIAQASASLATDVGSRIDAFDITGALERVWELVRELNRYVVDRAPWQVAKDETRAVEVDEILYDLAEGLRLVAIALAAYLPTTATRILEALGQPEDVEWGRVQYGQLAAADGIEPAPPLFPRVETATSA